MTDYIITMDTGEQFIAHHGVKGMKWGKWNPETAARYTGDKLSSARKTISDKYNSINPETKNKIKTGAKVAAGVAGAAALGAGAYQLNKYMRTSLPAGTQEKIVRALNGGTTPGVKYLPNKSTASTMLPGGTNSVRKALPSANQSIQKHAGNALATRGSNGIEQYVSKATVLPRKSGLSHLQKIRLATAAGGAVGGATSLAMTKARNDKKQKAKDAVDEKVNESIVKQHQDARKDFREKTDNSISQSKDRNKLNKSQLRQMQNVDISNMSFTDSEIRRMENGESLESVLWDKTRSKRQRI